MKDYTDNPIKARIFCEPTSPDPRTGQDYQWSLDGIDGQGGYTEAIWNFDTWAEAWSHVPDFWREYVLPALILPIASRKADGIDCTEDESCVVLRYFDAVHPDSAGGERIAVLFPLEADQWWREREAGYR